MKASHSQVRKIISFTKTNDVQILAIYYYDDISMMALWKFKFDKRCNLFQRISRMNFE